MCVYEFVLRLERTFMKMHMISLLLIKAYGLWGKIKYMHKTAKWKHKMMNIQEVYIESALGIRTERHLSGSIC